MRKGRQISTFTYTQFHTRIENATQINARINVQVEYVYMNIKSLLCYSKYRKHVNRTILNLKMLLINMGRNRFKYLNTRSFRFTYV